jgi:RNA polymerase sigma factor (sigma-70 family)
MKGRQSLQYFDLSALPDETLVLLAKLNLSPVADEQLRLLLDRYARVPALATLIPRHDAGLRRLVRRPARAMHLRESDVNDEEQATVFAIYEAVARFDPGRCRAGGAGSFRRFVRRIAHDRFRNHARRQQREERHYDRSVNLLALAGGPPARGACVPRAVDAQCGQGNDPATAVERQELLQVVQGVLAQFTDRERFLLEQLASGSRLTQVAAELGVSYATAKRDKDRLLLRLQCELKRLLT